MSTDTDWMARPPKPRKGWTCPQCAGRGNMADGTTTVGSNGARVDKPASQCPLCKGKGLVLLVPMPDEEDKKNDV